MILILAVSPLLVGFFSVAISNVMVLKETMNILTTNILWDATQRCQLQYHRGHTSPMDGGGDCSEDTVVFWGGLFVVVDILNKLYVHYLKWSCILNHKAWRGNQPLIPSKIYQVIWLSDPVVMVLWMFIVTH